MQRMRALAKLVMRPAASKILGAAVTPRAGIIATQAVRVSIRSFGGQAAHGHGADEVCGAEYSVGNNHYDNTSSFLD